MASLRQRFLRSHRSARRTDGERLRVESLEARILYSGELAALAPDDDPGLHREVAPLTLDAATSETSATVEAATRIRGSGRELVIVDARVPDATALVDGLRSARPDRAFDVLMIDAGASGFSQLEAYTAGREPWAAWHVFSHAAPDALQLGADTLSTATLAHHALALAQWQPSLEPDADLLLYGCDLAATDDGRALVAAIARLTGADVAASEDPTGAAALGGDFDLEVRTGAIEVDLALDETARKEFGGLLATYTVTSAGDTGPGTLRQAILDANANAGADTIAFNLPGSPLSTITVGSALPNVTDTVTIDGTTDPSFAGNGSRPVIRLNGNNAVAGNGLTFAAGSDGSLLRGMIISGFGQYGVRIEPGADNVTVAGNYVGSLDHLGNDTGSFYGNDFAGIEVLGDQATIGGAGALDRNVISGNQDGIGIDGAFDASVRGNYIGTAADGITVIGSTGEGVVLRNNASFNEIGGTGVGDGNVIAGSTFAGVLMRAGAHDNLVAGNRIGVSADGNTAVGVNDHGIEIADASHDNALIGNWIAGTTGRGIHITAGSGTLGTLIQGNRIGTDATGTLDWGTGSSGIHIANGGADDATIGGTNPGDGNLIAFSGSLASNDGISLDTGNTGVSLLGNIIYGSAHLAIDQTAAGVQPNDPGDTDSGANNGQNYPVLHQAVSNGVDTHIAGSLNSNPGVTFRIEFFANPAGTGDASGHGEARSFLGSTTVTTDAGGDVDFDVTLGGVAVAAGDAVTATATVDLGGGNMGDTSELAANVAATFGNLPPVLTLGEGDKSFTEGGAAVLLDAAATVADPDSGDFAGGQLTVDITANAAGGDVLDIRHQGSGAGQIGVVGNDVFYGGLLVATYSGAGGPGVPLTVTFNAGADAATVQAVVRNLTYGNTAEDPEAAARTIRFRLTDGDGATSVDRFKVVTLQGDADLFVTTTADTADGNTTSIDALLADRGADGRISLREALLASNATAGTNQIHFSIPDALIGGVHTLLPLSALPTITDSVVIDGTTEPDHTTTPVIEIDGSSSGGADGLILGAGSQGSVIRGLAINRFADGIELANTGGNTIAGNFIGTDASGLLDLGNAGVGIRITAGIANQIGGSGAGEGNIVAGNASGGILIDGLVTGAHVVEGNLIGLGADGTSLLGNDGHGIEILSSGSNTIGGPAAGAGNRIADSGMAGIAVGGGATGTTIQGNLIGTDATRTLGQGNQGSGILLQSLASDNLIGGTGAGEGNVIAYSGAGGTGNGVTVWSDAGAGNAIVGNAVFGSAGLAIDLGGGGITANDPGDGDGGPNDTQNHPMLLSADVVGDDLRIVGALSSEASTQYRIEFFNAPSGGGDPSGRGELDAFLGFATVTTDALGHAPIDVVLAGVSPPVGSHVSATATVDTGTGYGSTSEAAPNVAVDPNDMPLVGLNGLSVDFTENGAVLILDPGAAVGDPDSPDFAGGHLVVAITANATADDRLTLVHQGTGAGQVGVSGATVSYEGTPIGTFSGGTDGATPLDIAFNASADVAAVEAVLRRVGFRVLGEDPSTQARTVGFTLSDGDGGTSPTSPLTVNVIADADIRVTTTSDLADGDTTSMQTLLADRGADGRISLREAILVANAAGGGTQILFAIDDPLVNGAHTIQPLSALPTLTAGVTIDGSSEPDHTGAPIVEIDGGLLPSGLTGLQLGTGSDGSVIRELSINNFTGGVGIDIGASTGHVIAGNFIGLDPDGSTLQGMNFGVQVNTGTNSNILIGGTTLSDANVIASTNGIGVLGVGTSGVTIQGNAIGTDAAGTAARGGTTGIYITGATGTVIGGSGWGNLISGNTTGIFLDSNVSGTVVRGNLIGTEVTGTAPLGNVADGIRIAGSGNIIGGTGPDDGNLIAFNGSGVRISPFPAATGNVILGNSIHDHAGLGIDLGADGVTVDDSDDLDSGANDLLNKPAISLAHQTGPLGAQTHVTGSYQGLANTDLRLEFYASSGANPSGHGEGERLIGVIPVTTDGAGAATFDAVFVAPVVLGEVVSATATVDLGGGNYGSTSEFAQSFTIQSLGPGHSLPGAQATSEDQPRVFSSGTGNAITFHDGPAGNGTPLQVRLTASQGTLTLAQTTGLIVAEGADGSAHMVLWGAAADLDAALDGATFHPDPDYAGPANLQVETRSDAQLVGRYTFELPGAPGTDSSAGVAQDGSVDGGAVALVDGTRGNVLGVDGTGRIVVPTDFGQPASVTLSAWVNVDPGAPEGVAIAVGGDLSLRVEGGPGRGVLGAYNDPVQWRETPSGQSIGGTGWHHLAYVVDDVSGTQTLYIDGVQAAQTMFGGLTDLNADATASIGSNGGGVGLQGLIDDARIYTRALDAAEIAALATEAPAAQGDIAISVGAVNDAPGLAGLEGAALAYVENDPATPISATITITDVDSPDLVSATVSLTGGFTSGEDVLEFIDTGSISGTFNPLTGVLALTGTDSLAAYEAALRSVTYRNLSDDPSSATRTLTVVVSDGQLPSNTVSRDITVAAQPDAPSLAGIEAGALGVVENAPPAAVTGSIVVGDVDSATIASATIWFTAGYVPGEDLLGFTATPNITGTFDGLTGALTLNGVDTVANYQNALRAVTYENLSDDPSTATRTLSFTVDDGGLGSNSVSRDISITAVGDAPQLATVEAAALAFTENDPATAITQTLTIADADSATLAGATVSIISNHSIGNDILAFADTAGITGSWDDATGVLTLSGTDSVAAYQTALRSVTYRNLSDAPSEAVRAVEFVVHDGTAPSSAVVRQVAVTAVVDPPVLDASGPDQFGPVGPETQVNTTTAGEQTFAGNARTVAIDDAGNHVVVWASRDQDSPTTWGIYGQRYDAAGTPAGGEFVVNTTVLGDQRSPGVAMNGSGGFVVVWSGNGTGDADGIFARRFDAAGVPLGNEFRVNTTDNPSGEVLPSVSIDGSGNFLVAWTDDFNERIFAQRFDASGAPVGGELDLAAGSPFDPQVQVSMNASGEAIVAWSGDDGNVMARRFDAAGNAVGSNFRLNNSTAQDRIEPSVALRDDGSFVASWTSQWQDADGLYGVYARTFDATGAATSGDILVNTTETGDQYRSSIALMPDGGFLVTWTSTDFDGSDLGIASQRFDAAGARVGSEFRVNTQTASAQQSASPVVNGLGNAVIAWTSNLQDGSQTGIYAQRFSLGAGADHVATFVEGGPAVAVADADATIADADSGTLASLTATLTNVLDPGAEVLVFDVTGTSIAGSFDGLTGELSLSGVDTLAHYQQVLRSIQYQNLSNDPTTTARLIDIVVNDGTADSNVATSTIGIVAVNDSPVVTGLAGDTLAYTEGAGAALIDQGVAAGVTDADSADFAAGALTVSFAAGSDAAQDVLAVRNQGVGVGQIGVSGNDVTYEGVVIGTVAGGSTGAPLVITLDAAADATATSALLRNITFENVDTADPTPGARTVRFLLDDGDGGTSIASDATVTVGAVNDAPILAAIEAAPLAYTENDPPAAVTATLAATDPDDAVLQSATVSLSAGYVEGEDLLEFTDTAGITGAWDAPSGVLTLTGADTVANYQAALRSVTYRNLSDDPATATRTISISVADGALSSNVETRDIAVSAVEDAPSLTAIEGTALAVPENAPAAPLTSTLTVADADSPLLVSATVSITANHAAGEDVLAFVDTATITGSWNAAAGVLTLTGADSPAAYEAALRSVTYQNLAENPSTATRTVSFSVHDGVLASVAATRDISVVAVNDAPGIIGLDGDGLTYDEGDGAVVIDQGGDAGVTDVDSADFDTGALTVSFVSGSVPGEDALAVRNQGSGPGQIGVAAGVVSYAGLVFGTAVGGTGGVPLTVTFDADADAAAVAALLRNITYENTNPGDPAAGPRGVRFTLDDGDGAASPAADTVVNVAGVNDAPVLAAIEPATLALTENDPATPITGSLTVTDADSPVLASATVSIAANYAPGEDLLAFADTPGITGVWDAVSGTLSLTGTDSVANYEAALRSITYLNLSEDPSPAARSIAFGVNDGVADSGQITRDVSVAAVNDAPQIVSDGGGANAGRIVAENTATVTTVGASDAENHPLVFSIAGGDDAALFSIDPATGVVSFAAAPDFETPLDLDGDNVYRVIVQAEDVLTGTDQQAIDVTVVNADEGPVSAISDADAGADAVAEDAVAGTPAGYTATATDPDAGTDSITYSLDDDAGGRFAIDPSSGVVTVANASLLDRETQDSHAITVRAVSSDGSSTTTTVTLAVTDVNDNPPVIPAQTLLVAEGSPLGSAVGIPVVTDADLGAVTQGWTFLGGDGAGYFAIDPATGLITVTDPSVLDINQEIGFYVQVQVSDGVFTSAMRVIFIELTNVDDPPVLQAAAADVAENTPAGTTVLTMSASDPDPADTLTFSILSSSLPGAFRIDAGNGALIVDRSDLLDFESATTINLSILVRDASGLVDVEPAVLTLTDVNEAPTDLALDNAVAPLLGGQVIGRFSALDPDTGDVLRFSLLDDGAGSFVLDATDGQLSLSASPSLGGGRTHDVTVTVTDTVGNQLTRTFTIQLTAIDTPTPLQPPAPSPAPAPEPAPEPEPPPREPEPAAAPTPATAPAPAPPGTVLPADDETLATPDDAIDDRPSDAAPDTSVAVQRTGRDVNPAAAENVESAAAGDAPPNAGVADELETVPVAMQTLGEDFTQWVMERLAIRRGELDFSIEKPATGDTEPQTAQESIAVLLSDPLQATGAIVSTAAIWWIARAGGLLTSLLIGTPTWRSIDPLPIVMNQGDEPTGSASGDDDLPLPAVFPPAR